MVKNGKEGGAGRRASAYFHVSFQLRAAPSHPVSATITSMHANEMNESSDYQCVKEAFSQSWRLASGCFPLHMVDIGLVLFFIYLRAIFFSVDITSLGWPTQKSSSLKSAFGEWEEGWMGSLYQAREWKFPLVSSNVEIIIVTFFGSGSFMIDQHDSYSETGEQWAHSINWRC